MKKEVLALSNYNIKISSAINLKNISISLMEGECTSFLGLISSGKSELVKVISGDEWSRDGYIFLDDILISTPEVIKNKIHKISEINYVISDWTVMEYIGLVSSSLISWIFKRSKLTMEIKKLFVELEISIDINKKLKDLSEVEKRIVDLVKAYSNQSRILIIEDEFSGLTNGELVLFKDVMSRIIKDRMTVIINANSNNVNNILADNYIILKSGQIIKKCSKDKITSTNQLERILIETSNDLSSKRIDDGQNNTLMENETVYKVKNLKRNNSETIDLSFARGQVKTILSLNRDQKERIFNILSGREIDRNVKKIIDGKLLSLSDISEFVENKIVSVSRIGTEDELLGKLSVGENILMPSINKFSSMDYLRNGSQISSMLTTQLIDNEKEYNIDSDSKKFLRSIFIVMERWYVFRPKVLILYEPFYQCDIYGASIIKTYINKFKKTGTSVIIVKSRRTDIEDISDSIIEM